MSQRHPLASPDSWVELRDPTELVAGDQMDIQDAMEAEGNGQIVRQMRNAIITVLVVNWQLPSPLPIPSESPDSLRLMKIPDYVALKKLIGPAEDIIFPPDAEPEDPQVLEAAKADPASPTGDAVAS